MKDWLSVLVLALVVEVAGTAELESEPRRRWWSILPERTCAEWRLPDLPFGDHAGDPIATGKPGLTIVDRIAAHPARDLCAVAYANGLVVICRIGHPDEMMLREGTGVPVRALSWSDDGSHLAIGDADGTLSIATFPKNMFK